MFTFKGYRWVIQGWWMGWYMWIWYRGCEEYQVTGDYYGYIMGFSGINRDIGGLGDFVGLKEI